MKAITQSDKPVEGVLITKALFSYAARLSHKRNERGGDKFRMCKYPQTKPKGTPGKLSAFRMWRIKLRNPVSIVEAGTTRKPVSYVQIPRGALKRLIRTILK